MGGGKEIQCTVGRRRERVNVRVREGDSKGEGDREKG